MKTLNEINSKLILLLAILLLSFGRSLSGLIFFEFRLGEYIVAFSLIIFIYKTSVNIFIYLNEKKYNLFFLMHLILGITFVVSLFIFGSDFFDPYIFKSSTYIWTISYIYLGFYLAKNFQFENIHLFIVNLLLVASYFISVIYYPEFISKFFAQYSDKFDYPKAHIHVLFYVIVTYLNFQYYRNKSNSYYYFLIVSSLFFPMFIFKSRGSFLAASTYFLFFVFLNYKNFRQYPIRLFTTLILCVGIFISSSAFVSDSQLTPESGIDIVEDLFENKNTQATFLSFYFEDDRIFSQDGNINWRLQIWQDVIFDTLTIEKILLGNGYSSKIPAMEDPSRSGYDGTNENVHNYFINIIARGGLLHLIIISIIYYLFLKKGFTKSDFSNTLLFITPIMIVSFFDASMENPHFPSVFYLFLGFFLSNLNYNTFERLDK